MRKQIPNLITCMNVISGTMAVFMAMYDNLLVAALLVLLAMVFDFFDGFAARLLHVRSEMGKELDSMADMVSFGVVPAVMAHLLIKLSLLSGAQYSPDSSYSWVEYVLMYSPLLIPAFSAFRLAKFNLDTRQTYSFIGMPTPANALFWVCLVLSYYWNNELFPCLWGNVWVLFGCVVVLSVLLVVELPMFSLKITDFSWKSNRVRYLYFGTAILLAILFQIGFLTFLIPLYFLFSLVGYWAGWTTK